MSSKFELYEDKGGNFRFRLKASNDQIILVSEAYIEKTSAERGIASVKTNAPLDERYERKNISNGKTMFNLKAGNHRVIGMSDQYESTAALENDLENVKQSASTASIDDKT